MTRRFTPAGRNLFAVLAVLAVALVLLRPACELWFSHVGAVAGTVQDGLLAASAGHGDAEVPCCATVSDPNSTTPLQAGLGNATQFPQGLAAASFFIVAAGTAALLWQPRWLRAPPHTPQSFYLRSTRILR